jgi:D-alanyl-D-alanine carboxypeptidase
MKDLSLLAREWRSHNGMLVSYPGADGMKTGFICESGFNIVVSATRDGRKLVAVVLGEPSIASRRARATDLLDNGFKRYFWKSLFGTSLDGLAIQASLTDGPAHLKDSVCGGGGGTKPATSRKRITKKGGSRATLNLDADNAVAAATGTVNGATDAAAAVTTGAVKATKKTLRKTVTSGAN